MARELMSPEVAFRLAVESHIEAEERLTADLGRVADAYCAMMKHAIAWKLSALVFALVLAVVWFPWGVAPAVVVYLHNEWERARGLRVANARIRALAGAYGTRGEREERDDG